jgi:protein TonB
MAAPVPRPSTSEDSISEIVRKPVKLVRPTYPQAARNARVGGEVELQALVGTDGKVEKVTVLSGHPMLVSAAADAVRGWRFEPLTINGRAVEFSTRVIIKFSLTGSES